MSNRETNPLNTWTDLLKQAKTERDVGAICRDFMALFTPQEMEVLPPSLKTCKFIDASDITGAAFDAVRAATIEKHDYNWESAHRLAAFLSAASHRVTHIATYKRSTNGDHEKQTA